MSKFQRTISCPIYMSNDSTHPRLTEATVTYTSTHGNSSKEGDFDRKTLCALVSEVERLSSLIQELVDALAEPEAEDAQPTTPVPLFQEKGRKSDEVRHGKYGDGNGASIGPNNNGAGHAVSGLHTGSVIGTSRFSNVQQHRSAGNTSSVHPVGSSSASSHWGAGHIPGRERGLPDQVMEAKVDAPQ